MTTPESHSTVAPVQADDFPLASSLRRVADRLEGFVAGTAPDPDREATRETSGPIYRLSSIFGMSAFECDILLLCAGMELDPRFPSLCAAANDAADTAYPTLALALAAFPGGHWSAMSPRSTLRFWRMVELDGGGPIIDRRLRIDERVLMHLMGLDFLDERLAGFVEPLEGRETWLPPSQTAFVQRVIDSWSNPDTGKLPIIQLFGRDQGGRKAIASLACTSLGLNLFRLRSSAIPTAPLEFENLRRRWDREAALSGSALLIHFSDGGDEQQERQLVVRFCESSMSPVFVSADTRLTFPDRSAVAIEVAKPRRKEQSELWSQALAAGELHLNGAITRVVDQFDFDGSTIVEVANTVRDAEGGWGAEDLWKACVEHTRPSFGTLAQRIEVKASFGDLVLPDAQVNTLKDIAVHVRHRHQVYNEWGFANKSSRGLGITALFSGPSGTGKTMAAEAIAESLEVDLYRIDLSQVVSKYIGETEKNLGKVFDVAENGGVVLLFDEADALFGKRTEVRDSHDRYANIEVSYLLQRVETYRGLTILTTNMKSALDDAFKRRIRFMVSFPFPPAPSRERIWESVFPADTPTEDLDITKLAQLNVTGGVIRNVAMQAAFLAADAREPVRMTHLLEAARIEHAKLDKPLPASEVKGWCD